MNKKWDKKLSIILSTSMVLTMFPINVFAKTQTRVTQSQEEDVYVDIIGEGERSTLFNDNWKFHRGDIENAESVDLNDTSWDDVDLPHDYSIDQSFTTSGEAESGFLLGGVGWYRKSFVVPEKYQDKQLMIEFDGAYMNAEVYLNGKKLGEHPYGYTAFAFDLTEGLICDGKTENVLVVKTDNKIPSSRWYSGSGIYRDVTLTVTNQVHVGYNGTQIIARDLKDNHDKVVDVDIVTTVENDGDAKKTVTVKNTFLDENGQIASDTVTQNVTIGAKSVLDVKQKVAMNDPELWSLENAYMYTMKTEIVDNDNVLDTYETDYGFRYYNFDNNTGFSLNGENMKLKGVSMHHDQGALGAVANRDAIERQVTILKDMGCNAIRVTHNPAADVLLDICNEHGMLVINEAFDGWTEYKNGNVNDYTSYFEETITKDNQIINGQAGMQWGEFDVKAMVDGAKNDPCVIMWSLGNEIDEGVSGNTSHYVNLVDNIIDWVQEIDMTRPLTIGDNRKGSSSTLNQINQKIFEAGGVIGMNYTNQSQTNSLHNTYPDWPLYGSETASAIHSRGIYNTKGQDYANLQMSEYDNDSAKVGWGLSASDAWSVVIQNDFNAGEFVWTGFDYIGEPTPWNGVGTGSVSGQGAKPNSSYFGIVDTAGFPKDTYYLYKSLWDEDSQVLHLMSTWNNNEIVKESNGKVKVDVYTNAAKVELYLNGRKVGEDSATQHKTNLGYTYQTFSNGEFYPSFYVTWEEGTLSAKAYDKAGNLISEEVLEGRTSVSTNTAATHLDAYANKNEINADGVSLSYITVDVKDRQNQIVAGANNRVQLSIEGNGKIVGVDNGNPADTDSYKGNSRKAFSGKALVIVQSTKEEGSFTLTASSDGLTSSSVTVKTKKAETEGEAYLQSYKISKNMYVPIGQAPVLPASVVGSYSNGDRQELNIHWDTYDSQLLNKVGKFTVTGSLENSEAIVTVDIHVIGEIVKMESYSTVTNVNKQPNLPQTLRGFYANGEYSEQFPVEWDIPEGAFAKEGIVVIKGHASVLDDEKEVFANVRVEAALAESYNIASKNNNDAPRFTNGTLQNGTISEPSTTAISDSLLQLNDGVTGESVDTSARWTNWAIRNTSPAVDTYLQLEWQQEYSMQNVKLWHFTDNSASVLPGDQNVRFEYYDNATSQWVEIESSHITQVSYLSGDTPYGFIHPVTTNKLRIWLKSPQVGKCIGLTEVEVYNYVEPTQAYSVAEIDDIKLDNVAIEDFNGFKGFDEETLTYSVELDSDKCPNISILTSYNESVVVLPIYEDAVKIFIKSEDGSITKTYTVQYTMPAKVDRTALNEAIETAEALNEKDYTANSWAVLSKALADAKALPDNAIQEQVDAALASLNAAMKALEEKVIVDKTALDKAIAEAEALNENDYTADSWTVLNKALADAKALTEEATQEQIDAALASLNAAMKALEEKVIVDKTALDKAIVEAEALNEKDYTAESWAVLSEALADAKALTEEATQEQVDAALAALNTAIKGLEEKVVVDKTSLNEAIAKAETLKENNYTAASWQTFQAALNAAKIIAKAENATQSSVNTALATLNFAIKVLDEKTVVDKRALNKAIATAEELNKDDYTAASWQILQRALKGAREIAKAEDVTQLDVNVALSTLNRAIQRLETVLDPVKPDPTKPEPTKPNDNEKPQKPDDVKTADNTAIALFAGMMLLSLASVCLFKKKED